MVNKKNAVSNEDTVDPIDEAREKEIFLAEFNLPIEKYGHYPLFILKQLRFGRKETVNMERLFFQIIKENNGAADITHIILTAYDKEGIQLSRMRVGGILKKMHAKGQLDCAGDRSGFYFFPEKEEKEVYVEDSDLEEEITEE